MQILLETNLEQDSKWTGTPFWFVKCVGIVISFCRLNLFRLTFILSSECSNIYD